MWFKLNIEETKEREKKLNKSKFLILVVYHWFLTPNINNVGCFEYIEVVHRVYQYLL